MSNTPDGYFVTEDFLTSIELYTENNERIFGGQLIYNADSRFSYGQPVKKRLVIRKGNTLNTSSFLKSNYLTISPEKLTSDVVFLRVDGTLMYKWHINKKRPIEVQWLTDKKRVVVGIQFCN